MISEQDRGLDRRSFLVKSGATVMAGTILPGSGLHKLSLNAAGEVPLRTLGRTGFQVYPAAIGGFCQYHPDWDKTEFNEKIQIRQVNVVFMAGKGLICFNHLELMKSKI